MASTAAPKLELVIEGRALPVGLEAIRVPPILLACLDQLVERVARRTGEPIERVRRSVEIAVLTRGVTALQEEYQT